MKANSRQSIANQTINGQNDGHINYFDALKRENIIEIAIRFGNFDNIRVFKLIKILFEDEIKNANEQILKHDSDNYDETDDIEIGSVFSKNLILLIIHLNEISLFEKLFQIEILHSLYAAKTLFLDGFSFGLKANYIMVLFHLLSKYQNCHKDARPIMISNILENIQEFTETNGGSQYRGVVSHLEEKLYLLEVMLPSFSKDQAKHFYTIAEKLLDIKIIDGDLSGAGKSKHILVLYTLIRLDSSFSHLKLDNNNTKSKYYNLINLFMNKVEEIQHIEMLVQEELYNKQLIIDVIAHQKMIPLLNNPKIISVVTDFWRGPYERHSFMSDSYMLKTIRKTFTGSDSFFLYNPEADNEYNWRKHLGKLSCQHKFQTKAHIFHFKAWETSMDTRYLINAIAIITIGIALQYYNNMVNDRIVKQFEYAATFRTLEAQL